MFSKFNYSPSSFFYNSVLNKYLTTGTKLYNLHQQEVQNCLSEYISDDGIISGTDLKENWFSITPKHVFISHSHKDLNKVKAFAGWLYENFKIEAFIDSCSWGYCDTLLNKIDNKYCYNSHTDTYSYNLRNYTTSHVHMMLSTALSEIMDKTECIIFFNTPNSINMSEELDNIKKSQQTASPWIYHELLMTTMLRKNLFRNKNIVMEHRFSQLLENKSDFQVHYDVTKIINSMPELYDEQLQLWISKWDETSNTTVRGVDFSYNGSPSRSAEEALDLLYRIVFPKK